MKIEIEIEDDKAQRQALYERAATLIGAFEDPEGATDLSSEHDHYLYD
jgi:hypothetical protein